MDQQNIRQYDVVRILAINRGFKENEYYPGTRSPAIGDLATVIEIYKKPELGYELESVNSKGETDWLVSMSPEDMEFEVIDNLE